MNGKLCLKFPLHLFHSSGPRLNLQKETHHGNWILIFVLECTPRSVPPQRHYEVRGASRKGPCLCVSDDRCDAG